MFNYKIAQKEPKNWSKTKITIEGSTENKSFSALWLDPDTIFETFPGPKKSPLGPKSENHLKNQTYQMSELKKTWKIEGVTVNEWTQTQFLGLIILKIAHLDLNFLSTSTKFQLNLNFNHNSLQFQAQINPSLNLNLNSIWLWHKSSPILLCC